MDRGAGWISIINSCFVIGNNGGGSKEMVRSSGGKRESVSNAWCTLRYTSCLTNAHRAKEWLVNLTWATGSELGSSAPHINYVTHYCTPLCLLQHRKKQSKTRTKATWDCKCWGPPCIPVLTFSGLSHWYISHCKWHYINSQIQYNVIGAKFTHTEWLVQTANFTHTQSDRCKLYTNKVLLVQILPIHSLTGAKYTQTKSHWCKIYPYNGATSILKH